MIESFDLAFIRWLRKYQPFLGRLALFIVFFWFGILKVVGLSPASDVVHHLFDVTMPPIISFPTFFVLFGLFECLIGTLFLVRGLERVVIPLLLLHFITTLGPLIMLAGETWTGFMAPTLEGQYIIKNLVIVALALGLAAHLHPLRHDK